MKKTYTLYILGSILGFASSIICHAASLHLSSVSDLPPWPPNSPLILAVTALVLLTLSIFLRRPLNLMCYEHTVLVRLELGGRPPRPPRNPLIPLGLALLLLAAFYYLLPSIFSTVFLSISYHAVVIPILVLYLAWSIFRLLSASTINSPGVHP
jgi:hypothetical protein